MVTLPAIVIGLLKPRLPDHVPPCNMKLVVPLIELLVFKVIPPFSISEDPFTTFVPTEDVNNPLTVQLSKSVCVAPELLNTSGPASTFPALVIFDVALIDSEP